MATSCSTPQGQKREAVQIHYRGRTIAVPRGTRLRTALLRHDLTPHNEGAVYINCRGLGSCGTCAVEILCAAYGDSTVSCIVGVCPEELPQPTVLPTEWTTAERLRLNFPPHAPPNNQRLRLACQVT